jgi:hypothetical protein
VREITVAGTFGRAQRRSALDYGPTRFPNPQDKIVNADTTKLAREPTMLAILLAAIAIVAAFGTDYRVGVGCVDSHRCAEWQLPLVVMLS